MTKKSTDDKHVPEKYPDAQHGDSILLPDKTIRVCSTLSAFSEAALCIKPGDPEPEKHGRMPYR